MDARERFHATFDYGQPDRVFLWKHWFFDDTLKRWAGEGMPCDAHLNAYFGFDRQETVPINTQLFPPLETKVVERSAEWEVVEDEFGGLEKRWTDRDIGMSQWLRYPVRDREGWEKLRQRLNPDAPIRYPAYWDDQVRCYAGRDFPLGIGAGSFYGLIRNWVGMENLALWYYDCPDLVHEMTEYMADFFLRLIERGLNDVPDIDYACMWEDMAMKTGPLISPAMFREFMLEPMKRVTRVLNEYGIKIIMVDSDGCVDELIPLWLEANVNLNFPLEVAAGCDAVRYRQQFGKDLLLVGNIDKRVLRDGCSKKDIEKEVMSKVPSLVRQGGFSPMVDHSVPPDVPFENFKYYMDLIHEVCSFH